MQRLLAASCISIDNYSFALKDANSDTESKTWHYMQQTASGRLDSNMISPSSQILHLRKERIFTHTAHLEPNCRHRRLLHWKTWYVEAAASNWLLFPAVAHRQTEVLSSSGVAWSVAACRFGDGSMEAPSGHVGRLPLSAAISQQRQFSLLRKNTTASLV